MALAGDLHPDWSAPRSTAYETPRFRLAQRTDGRRVVTTSTPVTADSQPDSPEHAPARGRRRWWATVGAVVVVAAVVVGVMDPFAGGHSAASGLADNSADPTSLQTVADQELSSQTEVSAILGYANSYTVVNQAQGTVTSLPAVGQVTTQGQVLYEVSGVPVVLLYGSTPPFRTLSEGVAGADVEQLNADLVALGYATSTELSPDLGRVYLLDRGGGEEAAKGARGDPERYALSGSGGVRTLCGPGHFSVGHSGGSGPAGPGGALRHFDQPSNQRRPRCR